jgi:hypothetical protein
MKFANATKFNRKSGEAKWSDLLLPIPPQIQTKKGRAISPQRASPIAITTVAYH